jgi:hypothetical protein
MLSETSGSKPLAIVNSYVIFWLAIELIFFFYAKFTGDEYKPLLCCTYKRVSHSLCVDEECHFIYNIFSLIMIIPFGVFNIIKGNYGTLKLLYGCWVCIF